MGGGGRRVEEERGGGGRGEEGGSSLTDRERVSINSRVTPCSCCLLTRGSVQ